jgi:hypothetical protein
MGLDNDTIIYVVVFSVIAVCVYITFQSGDFSLKCIVSDVDGNKYCVRERKRLKEAGDLLASITQKCVLFIDQLKAKYPDDEKVQRLARQFNPKNISETLPTSSYTAYSENKGAKTAFCLNRTKTDNTNLIDEHTLMFVALHELSHDMSVSRGHKDEFWENFKFLLEEAKAMNIHNPIDYKNKPQEYCGMKINDNPYYDLAGKETSVH